MRVHSKVRLVTNSSSETFTFSSLGRSQDTIDGLIDGLWAEFCLADEYQDDLRRWWNGESFYCCGRKNDTGLPYSREAAMNFGSPISFRIEADGKCEHYTSMDNDEVPDKFARFVEMRMNNVLAPGDAMNTICAECMRHGRNTCPPCRL